MGEKAQEQLTVFQALNKVMEFVGSVGKDEKNQHFHFNFRGIDAVLNAVSPGMKKYGVVAAPVVEEIIRDVAKNANGRLQVTVQVKMTVRWYGPAGDSVDCTVWGEAMDTGDKATAKAHSVALRTAYIQMLSLPTTETDPDNEVFDVAPQNKASGMKTQVKSAQSAEDLRGFWRKAQAGNFLTDELKHTLEARMKEIDNVAG